MFDLLSNAFSSFFSKFRSGEKLTSQKVDATVKEITDALLGADVPYDVANKFTAEVKDSLVGTEVPKGVEPGEHLMKIFYDRLLEFLGGEAGEEKFKFSMPSVVMMMGLQGSGKTTTISKFAHLVKKDQKNATILLGSVDFYRPAAIDQLETLAGQVGVDFVRAQSTDPVKATKEIHTKFKNEKYDLLFLDTAGRMHVDERMLEELKQIEATVKPKYKVMVLDSMTGQESLKVAEVFNKAVDFSWAVLSKMDSDARGGAAFSFRYVLKKPVMFIGTGEKPEDLEQFRPERIAQRILGMGDIMTLVERADEKIKKSEQEAMERALMSGKITLEDFAAQMDMVNKMGSLSKIMKYMPGGAGLGITPEMIEEGEREAKRFRAIISSMTRKERLLPEIITGSRKERVAKGAGVKPSDVDSLIKRFNASKKILKQMKKSGFFGKLD